MVYGFLAGKKNVLEGHAKCGRETFRASCVAYASYVCSPYFLFAVFVGSLGPSCAKEISAVSTPHLEIFYAFRNFRSKSRQVKAAIAVCAFVGAATDRRSPCDILSPSSYSVFASQPALQLNFLTEDHLPHFSLDIDQPSPRVRATEISQNRVKQTPLQAYSKKKLCI